jgi:apolipoprotein D and lipocalin family protein
LRRAAHFGDLRQRIFSKAGGALRRLAGGEKLKKKVTLVLLVIFAAACARAGAKEKTPPPEVVPEVDLDKYAGRWYEVARFPNRFQKDCTGDVTATYTLREDGEIDVLNQCREKGGQFKKAEGRARRASKDGPNTKLEVRFAPAFLRFLPFVWGDYWIIDLAPDYSHAVVGDPSRKYLWVLARAPQMGEEAYRAAVSRAEAQGFDVSRLSKTTHTP